MGYLEFDKNELINLEFSLHREIIRSNRAGSYASTTIIGCNTRKYHGLLICPCHKKSNENHVLLSSLDATIVQHEQEFNLGIHKFQGDLFIPRGHKYAREYRAETVEEVIYRVGGAVLRKESILVEKHEQILIRYTLLDASSQTTLKLRPFLAFRNVHSLSRANLFANTKYRKSKNGISSRLYEGFPYLYMQLSKNSEFVAIPDWYYNIEYPEEQRRGYDYKEDLFVPGYFEVAMRKGESIVFSASTSEVNPSGIKKKFSAEKKIRITRNSFMNCLLNSAEQFLVKKEKGTEIIAGYPWFGSWGRDTFISLPGLTLSTGNYKAATSVLQTIAKKMRGGLFPNKDGDNPAFNSADAPMWFIYALREYEKHLPESEIWKTWGNKIKLVLKAYRYGTSYQIRMDENALIWAGEEGKALTWMDAVNSSGPVTPRIGMPVEINALWYNNIVQSLEWAEKAGDKKFVSEWEDLPGKIADSFLNEFWSEDAGYLADFIDRDTKNFDVRPNQVIAAAMDHSPLNPEQKSSILEVIEKELFTPKGLRTLSPKNPSYKGVYEGDQDERDAAYHQGTAWPWLLEFFVRAWLELHKNTGVALAKRILLGFEDDMTMHGIGSISEIYDGNPPHSPKGAVSQAWSVAALLRINEMIVNFEKENVES